MVENMKASAEGDVQERLVALEQFRAATERPCITIRQVNEIVASASLSPDQEGPRDRASSSSVP